MYSIHREALIIYLLPFYIPNEITGTPNKLQFLFVYTVYTLVCQNTTHKSPGTKQICFFAFFWKTRGLILGRGFVPYKSANFNMTLKSVFSSRTPKPKLWIFSSRTPYPKLLTAKLEGTGTNPSPRIRPPVGNPYMNTTYSLSIQAT